MSPSFTAPATIRRSVRYPVPREQLFRAWTTPETLKNWWRLGAYTVSDVAIDLRRGGEYRITLVHLDGSRASVFGSYLDVVAPERLVMTWLSQGGPRDDDTESLLTLEFLDHGDWSTLRLKHERLAWDRRPDFNAGWTAVLGHLASHVARLEGHSP